MQPALIVSSASCLACSHEVPGDARAAWFISLVAGRSGFGLSKGMPLFVSSFSWLWQPSGAAPVPLWLVV